MAGEDKKPGPGRPPTAMTRDQVIRREAMELVLQYPASFTRHADFNDLSLEGQEQRIAEYSAQGVASD